MVEIPRDGEYVIEGTRIDGSALRDELQRRLRESPKEGRVVVLVDGILNSMTAALKMSRMPRLNSTLLRSSC